MRNSAITDDDIKFDDSAALKLLSQFKSIEGVIDTKKSWLPGDYSQYNAATILTAVLLGFGNFSRWFEDPVTHIQYAQFIREASFIIRTKICKCDNQIVIINDNASIHKVKDVLDVVEANNINFFYIVPYSPQTNLQAENYF